MPIYDQSTLGVTGNQITFNDFSSTPVYRASLRRPQNRDIRQFDTPLPQNSGIADFQTLIGQVNYVLEGTMYPNDTSEWRSGRRALKKLASVDVAQNDPSTDLGYVPYTHDNVQIFMKVLYVDLPENNRQGLVQPFKLFCKIKDPVEYGTTLKEADTGTSTGQVTGAVQYPLEYPAVIGKNTFTLSSTVRNEGDLDAYPESITVNGPTNKPRVTNSTTGEYIEVDINLASDTEQLIISYDADNISVEKDGDSVYSSVTSGSNFFKLPPGDNTIELTGSSLTTGAYVILTMFDAYPLS